MQEYSKEVIQKYLVRKSRKQKTAFINRTKEVLEEQGYQINLEQGGLTKSRNIVVGDIEQAQVIYTAHYDTCPAMPLPNFITPKNLLFFICYQLLLTVLILGLASVFGRLISFALNNIIIGMLATVTLTLLCCYQIIAGVANPNTYNDNTSGVVTLIEIAMSISKEERGKAAFVFFDNEELGLLGSALFKKMHHKVISNTLIVNFDCVSDGKHLLVIANKQMRKDHILYDSMKACLTTTEEKQVVHTSSASTIYPSDQMNFKKYVAIAAVHKAPILGYYLGRIHTPFDTRFDEHNIGMLSEAMVRFTGKL